jgi:hypothetical protein
VLVEVAEEELRRHAAPIVGSVKARDCSVGMDLEMELSSCGDMDWVRERVGRHDSFVEALVSRRGIECADLVKERGNFVLVEEGQVIWPLCEHGDTAWAQD